MRIMMSAAASPVAPSIIRHLKGLGHTVIGHDSSAVISATGADRHIRSPLANGNAYLRFLRNFEQSYDVYLPFLDEELRLFGIGERPAGCLCSPNQALLTFTSKIRQQRALALAGLPVCPEVEAIIKPDEGRGGKGIFKTSMAGGFVIQKRLKGPEYTIDVLTDMEGNFLYAVPRERLVANGVSVIGRIKVDKDLIDLARDVCNKFSFAGPINIQVISDPEDDYIIEVNPRLSGSCMFTVMAGWDILADTIKVQMGEKFVPPKMVKEVTIRRTYVEEII
jgi:carbamoyl-phosphate synthase large subunit